MASILGGQSKRTLDGLNPDKFASWISKYSYPDEERFWQAVSPFVTPSSLSMGDNMELSLAKWGYNKTSFRDNLREWLSDCSFSNNQSIKDNANKFLDNMGGLTFLKRFDKNQGTNNANFSIGSATATITASRGTSNPATYIDSDGVIISRTTSNTGRYTQGFYDTTGFVSRPGLIVEGAGTNMLQDSYFSQTFATYWRALNTGTVSQSSDVANIYGGGTVAKLVSSTDNDGIQTTVANKPTLAATTTYTVSAIVSGSGSVSVFFTTSNSTVFNESAAVTLSSTPKRIQVTATTGSSFAENVGVWLNGNNSTTCYIHAIQLEALPFASTFIPTTTAALTRNAETLTYPISGNRTAATESIFSRITPFFGVSGATSSHSFSGTDTKNRVIRIQVTSGKFRFKPNETDETAVLAESTSTVSSGTSVVVAGVAKHASPYAEIYVNGTSEGTYVAGDWTSNAWGSNFNVGVDSGTRLDGIISSLAIFSDAKDATAVAAISNLMAGA